MKQTTETTQFTAEICAKWLNQLAEVSSQIKARCKTSKIKECIVAEIAEIDEGLSVIALNIAELLKQQHLNDHFFRNKGNSDKF